MTEAVGVEAAVAGDLSAQLTEAGSNSVGAAGLVAAVSCAHLSAAGLTVVAVASAEVVG